MRNCERCGAGYSPYNDNEDNKETWVEGGNKNNETKGLCQFCNPNTKYFNK